MQYRIPQQVYPEDPRLNQSGDDRPNTGLREGNIPHGEVNDTIRSSTKTVIFGQQTRLRNGELLPDQKLPRFHAGHDLVNFFYSAVRSIRTRALSASSTLNKLEALKEHSRFSPSVGQILRNICFNWGAKIFEGKRGVPRLCSPLITMTS